MTPRPTIDKEAKVAPVFRLVSPLSTQVVQGFDAAWQRSQTLTLPVRAELQEWARVDK